MTQFLFNCRGEIEPRGHDTYDNCESCRPISGVPAPDTTDWNHDDGKVRKRNQVAVHRLQSRFRCWYIYSISLSLSLSLSLFLFSRHKRTRQLHGGPWPGNCNWDSEISLSVSIRLVLIPLVDSRYPSSRLPSLGEMKQNERKKRVRERERERKKMGLEEGNERDCRFPSIYSASRDWW